MNVIYALYPNADSAERAFGLLRGAGIELRNLVVLSSEPFDERDFGRLDAETPMPWLAALGGIVGGVAGYLLAALTQKAYPLPTGGMPIVALWTNGIITYELMMLGAIVFTLMTLLAGARLPDWRKQLYDPEISDGKILIGVLNPPDGIRAELERRFREAGASQVKEFVKR